MNLIKIRSFDNSFSANITLTKLQDSGIACYLFDENTIVMNPIYSNVIGGIRLMVKEEDLEKASEFLQQFDQDYLNSVRCPKCGQSEINLVSKPGASNIIMAVLTWTLSSYAIAPENIYQCSNCKFESINLPISQEE